jgi:hypothetical protein
MSAFRVKVQLGQPTSGHTPRRQSLKLRLASGDIVVAAGSCCFWRTLRERRLPQNVDAPQNVDDCAAMPASLDRLEQPGARTFFGHDPEFRKGVPQAPAEIV